MSKCSSYDSLEIFTFFSLKIGRILLCSWMDGSSQFEANFYPTVEVKTFRLSLPVISSNVTLGYYINEN